MVVGIPAGYELGGYPPPVDEDVVLEAGYRSTICGGKESDVDEVELE
jgi:hypothetical protein